MRRSKFLVFTFLFALLGLMFFGLKVNATVTTSSLVTVQGAQVRTSGSAGIRFVGSVDSSYDTTNVTAYGISIAFGEANVDDIVVGGTVNGKSVLSAQVSSLDGTNYYINLTNIPTNMYAQEVTARSYVVDGGEVVYSESAVTRTLGQVTLAVKSAGQTSDLIEQVLTELSTSYKYVYTDTDGNVYVTNPLYETDPAKLEAEFVKDWNAKFATTWTEITYTNLQASACEGTTPITADSDTDASGTNMYAFFITDEDMNAKWSWMFDYFNFVGSKVHPKRQINALLNGGSYNDEAYTNGTYLWMFKHLSASIANFFNGGYSRDKNNDIVFDDASVYYSIPDYNQTIYANDPNLVAVGNDITLATPAEKTGYDFAWYEGHSGEYIDSYEVASESILLAPTYKPVEYSVSYYFGEELIDGLTSTYTIESGTVTLPTYALGGYAFKGWYENSDLSGTAVTEIAAGSTGNKVYYANMQETEFVDVNVTFDTNGGVWNKDYLLENADILAQAKVTQYLAYASGGASASLHTTAPAVYWGYIVLGKTNYTDIYEIKEVVSRSSYITQSYDYVIMWHSNLSDAESKTVLDSVLSNASTYAGKYVVLEDVPSEKSTSCSITINFIDSSELTKSVSTTYTLAETLPVVSKDGYTFAGWNCSIDSTIVSEYPGYQSNPGDITYTAVFTTSTDINANVTFDYDGGTTEALYKSNGTVLSTLTASSYNGNFWNLYESDIFVYPAGTNYNPQGATRIYIALNDYTNFYTILGVQTSGVSSIPDGTEYIITISDSYSGTYNSNFTASNLSAGDVVFFSTTITSISSSNLATISFYDETISNDSVTATVTSTTILPTPVRVGYTFDGWYDSSSNLYDAAEDFAGKSSVSLTAKWTFNDQIIGNFEDGVSYVVAGDTLQLGATYIGGSNGTLSWTSSDTSLATVTSAGTVTGVSEGLATIVVSDSAYPSIKFTFYVTVFDTDPSGMLKVLVDSNNASIFTRDNLGIGAGTPSYYYDVVGSVSKLLFEDYVVHKDYYLSSPSKTTTLTGSSSTKGVDFITFHYAADMPYSATYSKTGGKNLASYNQSASGASWHYSTGNDGVWYCQNTAWGAWHAGTSKTMTWTSSGVTTSQVGTDVMTTDVTLGSDNYFYIKGVKTSVQNTTGYSYTKFNDQGLGVKLSGSTWYLGGHYYNSSYAYICSTGGNNNSVGIESSVREGSDLWLTWQYSAQLCAQLLIEFGLPLNRLVGHHFFSGKDCPQPLLENDLEIWYEFVELTRQQMAYYQNYSGYSIAMSSNSAYVGDNGRVNSLPTYSECVTYTVTYTTGSTSKTVTLSSIIPGTIG